MNKLPIPKLRFELIVDGDGSVSAMMDGKEYAKLICKRHGPELFTAIAVEKEDSPKGDDALAAIYLGIISASSR